MTRGELRLYLGAAPGVGKTYAMLSEAHRRAGRGADVVIGFVEPHGRQAVAERIGDIEVVGRITVERDGATFEEMDVDAVLARRPEIAVVDELAHSNAAGCRNAKRWQDVHELLDAGITVLSTLNIQHLDSLHDVVAQVTGVDERETIPDEVVRDAEQVELVDMTPEALRRRMAHGNVFAPEKLDAALGNYFRIGNLTALRELALLWLADKVDDQLERYRAEQGIGGPWEARERVVVALAGGPEGETLIRRGARIAGRGKGADLLAVYVTRSDDLADGDPALLAKHRLLIEGLGGTFHQVAGRDVPEALLDFARAKGATQLVIGASRRGRFAQILSPGIGVTVTSRSGPIDVHLVTHSEVGSPRRRERAKSALSSTRRLTGFALAIFGLPLVTTMLLLLRDQILLPTDVLVVLAAVIAVTLIGGLWPALVAATAGFLQLNFFFTEPRHSLIIADLEEVLALVIFLVVAVSVSAMVDLAARRSRDAARASADAQLLATVAGSVLGGERPMTALLERLRETFGLDAVTVLERDPDTPRRPGAGRDDPAWRIVATVGKQPALTPADGDAAVPADDDVVLVLSGHRLPAADQHIAEAFAAQAAIALRQQRLAEEAAAVRPLTEADKMRTALLAAVSHDLRTPLASAKASVTSLRDSEIAFSDDDRAELLATADESLDRLSRLVANLLDMSRLQAGVLGVSSSVVGLEEVVPRALDELGAPGRAVRLRIPEDLPAVVADPGLLERILVNVLANALRFSPSERPPVITASRHAGSVELRVVDRGPGIPESQRDEVFLPFQRLGDRNMHTGVGLGLALSSGLAEAMGGTLRPETTPGGGLTMVLTLESADTSGPRATRAELA